MSSTQGKRRIEQRTFGQTRDGRAVEEFTLVNAAGASVKLLNYGATIISLRVPDKSGNIGEVTLGFDNIEQYETESPYFGSVIGRVGNRIAGGRFKVDGEEYAVMLNNGHNHLHGGFNGYDKRIWTAEAAMTGEGPTVRFTLIDPIGAEGYPGSVNVTVLYTFTAGNGLKIQYFATTDSATPINLTNHAYWNLKDGGKTDVLGHILQTTAEKYVPVDDTLIPTGVLAPVEGTPIDFRKPKPIGQDIAAMGGYDHTLVLHQDGKIQKSVEVFEPESGRRMEVWTDQPGVQFYSGNFIQGPIQGPNGAVYDRRHGFCLETQFYPDSVNQPQFPSTILRPGRVYRHFTEYRFFVGQQF
jgi:aldose 1-epimerase